MNSINQNIIFELNNVIWESDNTKIYCSQIAGENNNSLYYAVKELINPLFSQEELEKEKMITQDIENRAARSIVIPVLWTITHEDKKYVVMQFKKNGLFLEDYINQLEKIYGKANIPIQIIFNISFAVFKSLKQLHELSNGCGYYHLDLHPGNIFMENVSTEDDNEGTAKFIDFFDSVSVEKADEYTSRGYTLGFSAPEMRNQNTVCKATDIYSLVAVIYRVMTGKIYDENEVFDIAKELNIENSVLCSMWVDFFEQGLMYNAKYRIETAEEALKLICNIYNAYEAYKCNDNFALLNIAYYIDVLPEKLNIDFNNEEIIDKTVKSLETELLKQSVDKNLCYYIFQGIWNNVSKRTEEISPKLLVRILNCGIACCNHTANGNMAMELYDKLELQKNDMTVFEYNQKLPRMAVVYSDRLDYEKAKEIINMGIHATEEIRNTYEIIAKEMSFSLYNSNMAELGKLYSAMGSYKAFTYAGDNEQKKEIISLFEKSIKEFEGIDSDDYWRNNRGITLCHYLHFLLICGVDMKEDFEKLAVTFFSKDFKVSFSCTQDLINILNLIIEQRSIDLFRLQLFLKALYTYYLDYVDDKLLYDIKCIANDKRIQNRQNIYHPLGLIYKYIALIISKKEPDNHADIHYFFEKAVTVLDQGIINARKDINILMCVNYQTTWIYNQLMNRNDKNRKLLSTFLEHCHNSGWYDVENKIKETQSLEKLVGYENS